MILQTFKPYTPSKRSTRTIKTNFFLPYFNTYKKQIIFNSLRKYGRNNSGKITVYHKGGGHKRKYRQLCFNLITLTLGKIQSLEYDPNRTAYVSCFKYIINKKTIFSYILNSTDLEMMDTINNNNFTVTKTKLTTLENIKQNTVLCSITSSKITSAKYARAAGTFATKIASDKYFSIIKLPSTQYRLFLNQCLAFIGKITNPENNLISLGKAGTSSWKNKRPIVRGSAMNAVDHPNGGGKDRSPIGLRFPKTPWGKNAHGKKTQFKKFFVKKNIFLN